MQRLLCYALALVAGSSGLVFQVVWARQLVQVFGATAQAAAVVLATFLGGLALGALFLGRLADRSDRPLRLAAWFMAFSCAIAAGGVALVLAVAYLLDALFAGVSDFPGVRVGYQFVFAVLVISPPTILLGGMGPALIRAMVSAGDTIRPGFSTLFAIETLGGTVGALLAGFWLIAAMGLHGALWLASGVGVAVSTVTLFMSRKSPPSPAQLDEPHPAALSSHDGAMGDRWLLAAVVMAGFAVLGMEVAWTRLLLLLLGGDTYAYTIVVSSFLLGLAFGGLIARWITVRLIRPLPVYAWLQMAAAGTSLALLALFSWLTGGVGQRWLASLEGDWGAVLGGRFALCFGILLVPSTLAGLSFPVAASHFLRRRHDLGRRTGRLYATSAGGNVLGSLATGFLLIALVGLQWSIVALAAMNLLAAACVVFPRARPVRAALPCESAQRRVAWLQTVLIVLGLATCAGWRWMWPTVPLSVNRDEQTYEVTFYREGLAGTVAVLQSRDAPDERLMSIDGVIIGESRGGVDEKQRMLAHLPFLLRPAEANQRIYTIGLGTGILAGELVQQPGGAEVVCVELSPGVIEGARLFADLNWNIHDHPRATIVVGDGIQYLRQNRGLFDAIVSDAKSRPGHIGNVAFHSTDFYSLCRNRLTPDGLMVQWVSLETPGRELRTILHTFVHSFPHSHVGIAPPDSLYLIGANQPLQIAADHIQQHLEGPHSANLREYGWRDACDILGLLAADGQTVTDWLVGDELLNTLQWPVLEFQSLDTFRKPAVVRKQENLASLVQLMETRRPSLLVETENVALLEDCHRSAELLLKATKLLGEERIEEALARLDEGLPLAARHSRFRELAAEVYFDQAAAARQANDSASAVYYYRKVAQALYEENVAGHWQLAVLFQQLGALNESAGAYYMALQGDPQNVDLRLEFAYLLAAMQRNAQSARQFQRILDEYPDQPRAHLGLGLVLYAQNQQSLARRHLAQAVKLDPALQDVLTQAGIRLSHPE